MSRQVVVDGDIIDYRRYGKGSVCALALHGWADGPDSFKRLASSLGSEYSVYAPKLPSQSAGVAESKVYDLHGYADFVKAFVDKLEIRPDLLIGHSNGGAIAIVAGAEKKLTPEKIVLIASSGIRNETTLQKKVLLPVSKIVKIPLMLLGSSNAEKFKKYFYRRIGSDYLVLEGSQQTFQNIVGQDVSMYASKLSVQTMLIAGAEDEAVSIAKMSRLADLIPDSTLTVIDGADHFLHIHHAKIIAKMIAEWGRA